MVNNSSWSIDTDAGIGTILGYFDSEYILHVVEDSLSIKFRPYQDDMSNMVDVLERQLMAVYANSPDYKQKVLDTRNETYAEIIRIICRYYDLTFTGDLDAMNDQEIYGIARTIYDIFVAKFTQLLIGFFTSYIINNADDIYAYLINDPRYIKPKESGAYSAKNYIDPKYITIHANINQVIYNMTSYNIPLQMILDYSCDPNTAAALGNMLVDNGDIYKNKYASYIKDPMTSASLLTAVKLALQGRTQEIYNIQ